MITMQGAVWFVVIAQVLSVPGPPAESPTARSVEITWTCRVENVSEGVATVDLWVPLPSDTLGQKVRRVTVLKPEGGAIAVDPVHQNRMYHIRFEAPFETDLSVEFIMEIERTEIIVPEAKSLSPSKRVLPPEALRIYLEPTAFIPIHGPIDTMAEELGIAEDEPLRAARKIYDYVIEEMTYSWWAKGAGKGDVLWACDSKKGSCTDYHSIFIALCRNQGIPADHAFGFPVPATNETGKIPSYHCWARFWVEGLGWIPVDASEADRHPVLRDYNFGSLTANQMKFAHGRDVVLEPPQQGKPLNMFYSPYAELDGVPHHDIKSTMTYKDIPPLQP